MTSAAAVTNVSSSAFDARKRHRSTPLTSTARKVPSPYSDPIDDEAKISMRIMPTKWATASHLCAIGEANGKDEHLAVPNAEPGIFFEVLLADRLVPVAVETGLANPRQEIDAVLPVLFRQTGQPGGSGPVVNIGTREGDYVLVGYNVLFELRVLGRYKIEARLLIEVDSAVREVLAPKPDLGDRHEGHEQYPGHPPGAGV